MSNREQNNAQGQTQQWFWKYWWIVVIGLMTIVVAALFSLSNQTATEAGGTETGENELPWQKDQITYLGAVEEWREAFGGFGYDDILQDCTLVSASVQKDIGPSQGPLESFDHAIGMVAQDGSVGVWQYASLVRDASGESRWEISSLSRDDTQETLLMIVDDWKAPEAWQGHTIVMATAYLYAVTPDDLGPALPIVYIAPNGVTVDTLGGALQDVVDYWYWQGNQYECRPIWDEQSVQSPEYGGLGTFGNRLV